MDTTRQGQKAEDRFEFLKNRIIQLKNESMDPAFSAYLDGKWIELQIKENEWALLEEAIEQSYRQYLSRMSRQQAVMPPVYQNQSQPQVQPVYQNQGQPQVPPVYQNQSQPQVQPVYQGQSQPPVQPVYQGQPQSGVQSIFEPQPRRQEQMEYHPKLQHQFRPVMPPVKPPVSNSSTENPQKSVEFKVGTVILGVLGIAFLLVAFITFGLNFMNSLMQGVFLYMIGIMLIVFSEFFVFKRIEKFSYCLTGLGISSLYVVTLINYIYLEIFSSWAALLITVIFTSFFFYLSRKKDSGMIRIICLIGCYLSLMPIHSLKNQIEFLIPAVVVFLVNLAGIYCPVIKRRMAVDLIQYICSFSVVFYLIYLQWISGLEMWPVYILICANIFTLHLLYFRTKEEVWYRVLYILGQCVYGGCMLYVGYHEEWLHFGVLGTLALCIAMTALFLKKSLRFGPYLFIALYSILAYAVDGQKFWFSLACLLVFAINKGCVRYFKEFPVPDAVYTMMSAIVVCFFMRSDEVRILGYAYGICILLSCCFMKEFKKYHIFTSLTFGWVFLLTEDWKPFVCSVSICVLAAVAIGAGFYMKDKSVRIYGLVMTILTAIKMVLLDFHEAQAAVKILVFFITGLLILGISFGYIYLEKRLEEDRRRRMTEEKREMQNTQTQDSLELNL